MTSAILGDQPNSVNNALLQTATPVSCAFDATTITPGNQMQAMYRIPVCDNSFLIGATVWSSRAKTGSAVLELPTLTFPLDGSGPQLQLATMYPQLSNNFTIYVNSTADYWPSDPHVSVTLYIAHQQPFTGQ